MDEKSGNGRMNKLVKRITVIHGSGEKRRVEVVYEHDDEDEDEKPDFTSWVTDAPRTFMKAGQEVAKEASRLAPFKIPKLGAFGIPKFGPFGKPKSSDDKDDGE